MKTALVCYATKYGSTRRIASIIAEELIRAGIEITLSPITLVRDPGTFDAVVIGSPLYMGKWLVEAREFITGFRVKLQTRPVAVFTVGYSFRDQMKEDIESGGEAATYVRTYIAPVMEGYFAGNVDPDSMDLADREITMLAGVSPGDFTNPEAVRAWAGRLPHVLFPAGI
jgi:menaquinone-dependent protoporphyrinogen oxidase